MNLFNVAKLHKLVLMRRLQAAYVLACALLLPESGSFLHKCFHLGGTDIAFMDVYIT